MIMRYLILLCLAVSISFSANAQSNDSINTLIAKGVDFHEEGKYEKAVEIYDEALKMDKYNVFALYEKSFSLYAMQNFTEAIRVSEIAIKHNSGSATLKHVYTNYGNCVDLAGDKKKAIKVFDEALKLFPDYFHLYFNKGITLSRLEEFDKALVCFQQSAMLNPKHASTHHVQAKLLGMERANIPAILVLGRFFILEPQGSRSKDNLEYLEALISANVKRTGDKAITISLSPPTKPKKKKENDFRTTELMLSMISALDFDSTKANKSKVELFKGKIDIICSSLKVGKKEKGFYWDYYAPYFIQMEDKGFLETFSYLVYASTESAEVEDWLNNNEKQVESFYNWSSAYKW